MEILKAHQVVNVQAYKANGTLYRQWNGCKVLEASRDLIVLLMYKTKVAELNGQRWSVREPIIWYMPKDAFYNTTGLIRKSGTYFYTNIASPPFYEEGTIKFIDYDLDIKAYPGQKTKVVDKNEFEANRIKMGYSPKLVKILEETVDTVSRLIAYQEGFFDEDVIDTYIKELVNNKDLAKKLLKIKWD